MIDCSCAAARPASGLCGGASYRHRDQSQHFGCGVRRFGARFSKPVLPKDVLTCGAKVTKVYDDKGLARADLDCWVKTAKGDTVLTGSATVGPHK